MSDAPFQVPAESIAEARKAAEQGLAQTRAAFEKLNSAAKETIDSLDAGFLMFGPDERLIVCNRRYRELYPDIAPFMEPGETLSEISRRWLASLGGVAPDGQSSQVWIERRLAQHRPERADTRRTLRRRGRREPLHLKVAVIHLKVGQAPRRLRRAGCRTGILKSSATPHVFGRTIP